MLIWATEILNIINFIISSILSIVSSWDIVHWQKWKEYLKQRSIPDCQKQYFCTLCTCSFHFWHFADVLVLSATWNDLFCSCVDEATIWWQMFTFVFLSLKRWFQFNSQIVRTPFASVMILNNWEMITETRSYIFRWRFRCRWRRVCVNSLMSADKYPCIFSRQMKAIVYLFTYLMKNRHPLRPNIAMSSFLQKLIVLVLNVFIECVACSLFAPLKQ